MDSKTHERDRHGEQSLLTRERLLDAALFEFSRKGFEGTSTRAIAKRAECHQPQINYHFTSKESLWEATMVRLFAEMTAALAGLEAISNPVDRFEAMLRRFVHFAARRPELNRIMVAEAMAQTPRLTWIVETYSRNAYRQLLALWREVRAHDQGADIDERVVYHLFIGAASLLWANLPEAVLLDPTIPSDHDAVLEAHADAIVRFFLPQHHKS